ncbi:Transmembrane protein 19 [Lamellibrachia satsuma]|nr:Transmembrane protein 19 [Lamellibrachia satsuma]
MGEASENIILGMMLSVIIPVALVIWFVNVIFYTSYSHEGVWEPLSPIRCIIAVLVPIFIAKWGLKRKSLNSSGAATGLVVGFVISLSNYCFLAALLVFFVSGSKLTKFRADQKRSLEENFKEGGQRNWVQVVCNAGVATELALILMVESGCGEFLVDFSHHYTVSWLCMGVLGALACSCGDTYASEVGSAITGSDPWLVTSWKRVPRGTNGGVSIVGLVSSVVGGLVVGVAYYIPLLLSHSEAALENGPSQWPVMLIGAMAGFVGSLVDSYIGATLQFSGYDHIKNCMVETPSDGVERISGYALLDNHSVNLLSSFVMAIVTPFSAFYMWQYFT